MWMELLWRAYYTDPDKSEWVDIRPDQIPDILILSIANCFKDTTVLRMSIFLDMEDTEKEYVNCIAYTWNGIAVSKYQVYLFSDGSYRLNNREVF